MKARIRRLLVEGLKLALLIAVVAWIHVQIVDTKNEVFATNEAIVDSQRAHVDRLFELEERRAWAGRKLARTTAEVDIVRQDLQRQNAALASEKANLVDLIDVRAGELRHLIQNGIDRLEGTTHSAYAQSQRVGRRIEDIERKLARSYLEMKQRLIYPVVQLRGNGTVGSGVVFAIRPAEESEKSYAFVLTAYHVVLEIMDGAPGTSPISDLRFLDPATDELEENARSATLVAVNKDADLAMIRVETDTPWPYTAELATQDEMTRVQVFEPVYAVGCPLGNQPMPSVGEISSQNKSVGDQNFWMINAPTFFGNSGGGVFRSQTGHLVGISSMIYTYGKKQPMVVPHMGLFVPLSTIQRWLEEEGYSDLLPPGAASQVARPLDAEAETPSPAPVGAEVGAGKPGVPVGGIAPRDPGH